MQPKGVQNADAIIATCKKTLANLGAKGKPEWKTALDNTVSTMEDMKGNFFIKTNFAIPVTNALLRNAIEVQSLTAKGDTSKYPEAFARLEEGLQNLINRGKMDGVSLT